LIFTKKGEAYKIHLVFSSKSTGIVASILDGFRKKGIKDEYEEIIDQFEIKEDYILNQRKKIRMLKEKEANAETMKIGKFISVKTIKFINLLDALNSNKEIYEQQLNLTRSEEGSL